MSHHMRWFKSFIKRIKSGELLILSHQDVSTTYDSSLLAKVVVKKKYETCGYVRN